MYEIESYPTDSGPEEKGGLIGPPGSLGLCWPTGFAGGGWLVRRQGEIVFAHAWRKFCLEYVEQQGGA